MTHLLSLFCLLPTAVTAVPRQATPTRTPVIPVINSDRQLLVDDYLIAESHRITKTLHQPTDFRKTEPVLLPDRPWEHRRITSGSVYYSKEHKKFRCWYVACNLYDSRPGFRGYRRQHHVPISESAYLCYAESADGIHWKKPELGLVSYRGSKRNNILLAHRGSHFDSVSVVLTPWDKDRPIKLLLFEGTWPYDKARILKQWGKPFPIRHGHYAWASPDGLRFSPLHAEPVIRAGDRSQAWYNPLEKEFICSAKTSHEGKRAQKYARSRDFVHWETTPHWIHRADERDHSQDEAEGSYGFRYGAQFLGYCEMRRIRPKQDVRIDEELMVSRDGVDWTRPIRRPLLATGPKESWKYRVVKLFSNPPIQHDNKLWLYYSGKTGRNDMYTGTGPNQSLCLAHLRVDGFVSARANEQIGVLVTRPVRLDGKRMHINAAADGGVIRVELRDVAGHALPGYAFADCTPISTDRLDHTVTWKRTADLPVRNNAATGVAFQLKQADLYSLWVE